MELPWWLSGKESACQCGRLWVQSLGQEYLLEKEMVTHPSILSWEIPWTGEPGVLQSMGSQRVKHYRATKQQQYIKWLFFQLLYSYSYFLLSN